MANEFIPRQRGEIISNAVTLLLPNGKVFDGWEDMTISKNLESIANTFSFKFDDRFQVSQTKWPFKPGDLVRVNIGSERVITGFIDNMKINFSAGARNISVSGRSKAGDLIDCSVSEPFEIMNNNVIQIAEKLTAPFVTSTGRRQFQILTSVESKIIEKFSTKPGESVFTAIDRAARLQGFFWVSTRKGNIRLTTISRARATTELHQDVNIKDGSISFNESQRYSEYTVIGNRSGKKEFAGLVASEPAGFAKDLGIERFRPLTIVAEGSVDTDQSTDRAQWEAAVRLGKGLNIGTTVQDWRQKDGTLWGVNQITRVRSKFLGVDRDFLISNVTHIKNNNQGTVTKITLKREDAFQPKSEIPKGNDPKFDLGPAFN